MIVIVDSNEQATNPRIVQILQKSFPAITVSKLKAGDLSVVTDTGKLIAIERKEPGDFLGSVGDGRIFRQVENMAKNADYSAIIITGAITFDKNDQCVVDGELTNWGGKAIRAAMTSIMWSACPILRSTPEFYPATVMEVVSLAEKPEKRLTRRERIVTFPPLDPVAEVLASFPNIGVKRARALVEFVRHGQQPPRLSEALMWATSLDAMKLEDHPEGWGEVIISEFRRALGLRENEVLSVVSYDENRGVKHASKKEKSK